MNTYKVSVISGEKELSWQEFEKKEVKGKQVLVKVDSCAICTLEQRIYSGVMKRYPFAGGHEASGYVEAIGDDVTNVCVGDKVTIRLLTTCAECYYCRSGNENQCVISYMAKTHKDLLGPGGLAEYMLVEAKSVYRLGADVDLSHGALAEPLACCVHSINNANIGLGDDVVVIGGGIMGAMHVQLAKRKGARVILCEVDDDRLQFGRLMGADVLVNSKKEDAVKRIKELTQERGADVVFCTVAIPEVAADAIEMSGKLARVIYYSSFHPDKPIDFSPNKIHSTEQIITGAVNPGMRDFLTATRLISSGLIDLSKLITASYPAAQMEDAYKRAVEPDSFRVIVKF